MVGSRGDFVAVDEPTPEEELRTTYADIPKADRAEHGILWRHINKGNLQLVGKVPHSRDTADASELVAGRKFTGHHATKKSPAQLDREIAEALGRFPHDDSNDPRLTRWRVEPSDLRVGQRFNHSGQHFEIIKIGRDKARTIWIARRHTYLGKEHLIDHRSFPMRSFYQQHLMPIRD